MSYASVFPWPNDRPLSLGIRRYDMLKSVGRRTREWGFKFGTELRLLRLDKELQKARKVYQQIQRMLYVRLRIRSLDSAQYTHE